MSKIEVNELAARSGTNISMTSGHTMQPNFHSSTVFPAGHVLQLLHTEDTTVTASTSTSYANTGFNLSITPSSTSSKVFMIFDFTAFTYSNNQSAEIGAAFKIVRDSTDIKAFEDSNGYTLKMERSANNYWEAYRQTLTHLDSPSTTSAVNYKLHHKRLIGGQFQIRGPSKITLMEIAG